MSRRQSIVRSSRQIRLRLIIICSVVAFIIAAIFSVMSYRISEDAGQQIETYEVAQNARLIMQQVKHAFMQDRIRSEQLILPEQIVEGNYQLRVSRDGTLIYEAEYGLQLDVQSSSLNELVRAQIQQAGWLTTANHNYVWALESDEELSLDVLLIKQTVVLDSALSGAVNQIILTAAATSFLAFLGALAIGVLIAGQHSAFSSELEFKTSHDTLTGIYNRDHIFNCINDYVAGLNQRSIKNSRQTTSNNEIHATLLLIDIDHFKEVNDALGHACGDELLKRLSGDIARMLRAEDILARFGGDEFAIWSPDLSKDQAELLAKRLINHVQNPIEIQGVFLEVGLSIGIASFPSHGTTAEALISRADIAMYTAKRQRLGVTHFNLEQDVSTVEQLRLTADLRKALFLKELVLYYQPQICLKSNAIVGCEVLIRWQHPELGLIFPDRFIDIVERGGMINEFTRYIIDQALEQNARWRALGFEFPVSVNISPYNLNDPRLLGYINERLQRYQIPACALELELTENAALADIEHTQKTFALLSEAGVGISIDDFGTGMSSLAYVKNLTVDRIKIDRAFITRLDTDKGDQAIVRAILGLCKDLQRVSVAEGIESTAVARILMLMGCDIVQGDYYGKAMPAKEFTELLGAEKKLQGTVKI
ncbi:putative bifunctional diguanylate cyclase/phosphodiesterase [Neptunicella sp. SCSIO 80796]|uniref:putative bifunctional diguanylate cyclase/phosphodiesterase n=1 Tax=Neptunicella plasticusilytica TaxID=3117012 RepID=UPI003A4DC922